MLKLRKAYHGHKGELLILKKETYPRLKSRYAFLVTRKITKMDLPTKNLALMLYDAGDLQLEERVMPKLKNNQIRIKVVADSSCHSTYKYYNAGKNHPRGKFLPSVVGHELAGEVVEVGSDYKEQFKVGDKVTVQPPILWMNEEKPLGYCYPEMGGLMQYAVLSEEALTTGSVMKFDGPFYQGSLAEPLSCISSAFRRQIHYREGTDRPFYGLLPGGVTVILGIGGPMGRGMNLMLMHGVEKPGVIIGTEVDEAVIERFENWFPQDEYRKLGIKFELVNPKKQNLREIVMKYSNGRGADDVFSMVAHQSVFLQIEEILGSKRRDSPCVSLFAGPEDDKLVHPINAKLLHYGPRTYTATKCGTIESMEHVLVKISHEQLDPARMIIAVQGLDTAEEMIKNMPKLGGKNLVYNHIKMPRVEIDKFPEASQQNQEPYRTIFRELAVTVAKNNGIWGANSENYLLAQDKIRLKPGG